MNNIEHVIRSIKREVEMLERDYKQLLKDASYRTVYPHSEEGIDNTLEVIIHRAFELKVCNKCDNFHKCNDLYLCMDSIDGSADMAKEYGDRCYNGLLDKFRE